MQTLLIGLASELAPTFAGIVIIIALAGAATIYQQLVQKLPINVRTQVDALVSMIVTAIEQKYGNTIPGASKKAEALTTIADIARSFGLNIDPVYADVALEQAVYQLHQTHTSPPEVQRAVSAPINGSTESI
jgi:hypothetical protein